MKRIVAIVLSAAMLLSLLCVSVFAEISVHVNFSLPSVGDTLPAVGDLISSTTGVTCNVQAIYTGSDIEAILAEDDINELQKYGTSGHTPTGPYSNQPYLVLISLFSTSETLSTATQVTSSNGITTGVLYDDSAKYGALGTGVIAYLKFTPAENGSQNNGDDSSNTDNSDSSDEGDAPSVSTPITDDHEVKVTYDDSVFTPTIVSVDFTWGAMEFTYAPSTEGLWNPNTHEYEDPTEDYWTSTTNDVTIINHSNTAINATFSYQPAAGFTEISGKFVGENNADYEDGKVTIESAVGKAVNEAPSATAYLLLDGSLAKNTSAKTVSGTVTITIQ